MRKYLLLLAAAAFVAAPRVAHAGYTATLAPSKMLTPDANSNNIADVGETFSVTGGSFASFVGDTPADPTIANNDLGLYKFNLNGTATAVNPANYVTYTGNYSIYYNDPSSAVFNVSSGTFTINATFNTTNGSASLNGWLDQTAGPAIPAFADLGQYGRASFLGSYSPAVLGQGQNNYGFIDGVIRAPADASAIPEPGSMALLATGLLPMAGLLRRRRKA